MQSVMRNKFVDLERGGLMQNNKIVLNELNHLIENAADNDCSYGITDAEKEALINHAKDKITHFSIENDFISVDEKSIQLINNFVGDLVGISNTKCSSWLRSKGIWLTYRFLSLCLWTGKDVPFVSYEDWGPFIFDLDCEQLAYYLFWRKRAVCGEFSICTNAQIWLYTFDLILNTCADEANGTLSALWEINEKYEELVPATSRKILNKAYHNHIIGDYCLYNMLINEYNALPQEYRITDDFPICESIYKGLFAGTGSYLASLAFTKKTTSKIDTELEPHMPIILEKVFAGLFSLCQETATNLVSDLIGEKRRHALWYPYSKTILNADTAKDACKATHKSFSIEKNTYVFIEHDDMSSDPTLAEHVGSLYWNDNGDRLERKGLYYHQKYSGATTAGKQLVTYIICTVRNSYRKIHGLRTLKEMLCPYGKLQRRINELIDVTVRKYDFDAPFQENANAVYSVEFTDMKCTPDKDKFQYKVSAIQKWSTQAMIFERGQIAFNRNSEREKQIKQQGDRSSVMGNEERNDNMSKINVLRKNFNVLKDAYTWTKQSRETGIGNNDYNILCNLSQDIIAPMLELSFDEGCQMWEYELRRFCNDKMFEVDCTHFTNDMFECVDLDVMTKVLSRNTEIKRLIFEEDRYDSHYKEADFIARLVYMKNFDLAQDLVELLLKNNHGDNEPQKNLYELLHYIISSQESRWKMHSEGIDFILPWLDQVVSPVNRAILESDILTLLDCVEGGAPKGAMPFSMLSEEGSLEQLFAEKLRQNPSHANSASKDSNEDFNKIMLERKEKADLESEVTLTKESTELGLIDEEKLNKCMEKLNALIGLESVKSEVMSLCNLMRVRRMRVMRNLKVADTSQHLVFTGNPGTGKTTVARLIGEIYHALGFLTKGHFVETDRSGLVAGYIGQTAIKTQEIIDTALGGILFIDEAYSLTPTDAKDFGSEAISTILKAMEDHRDDFVVIVAGYDNLMADFIKSNPGLQSRFNNYIHFPDYTGDNLMDIFLKMVNDNGYVLNKSAEPDIYNYFCNAYKNRDENFGNGRDVRNLFEKIITRQANRVIKIKQPTDNDIIEINLEDFENVVGIERNEKREAKNKIIHLAYKKDIP